MRLLGCFFAHGCRKIAKKHPNSRIFRKSCLHLKSFDSPVFINYRLR